MIISQVRKGGLPPLPTTLGTERGRAPLPDLRGMGLDLSHAIRRLRPNSCARSVIMNDSPTGFRFPKQQRKGSVRLVVRAFQTPAAENQRRVFAQHIDFKFGKRERPHLLARVVALLVAIKHGLPAAID